MTITIKTLPEYFPEIFVNRIIISAIAFAVFCIVTVILYKRHCFDRAQCVAAIMLSMYVVVLLYFTVIGRYSHDEYDYQIYFFYSYRFLLQHFDFQSIRQVVINLVMLIPGGFLLSVIIKVKGKYVIVLVLCLLLTVFIESMQLLTKCGSFEVDDIINNMIGAVIGMLIYTLIHWITHQKMYKGKHYVQRKQDVSKQRKTKVINHCRHTTGDYPFGGGD